MKSGKAIKRLGRAPTRGEVACAMAHRQLYEYILKLGLNEVIVLEDDVLPHFVNRDYFFNYIQEGKIEFPNADLFLVHNAPNRFKKNRKNYIFLGSIILPILVFDRPFVNSKY